MTLLLSSFLLIIGFVAVIKGADWLVEGASSLAKKYKVSELTIGLTIVAFGTSAPELAVNMQANAEIVFGNVIGSNAFNLLFILGIAGLIYPLRVMKKTVYFEIPISLVSVLILLFMVNDRQINHTENMLSRADGVVLILFFLFFLLYVFFTSKQEIIDEVGNIERLSTFKTYLFLVLGIAGLVVGGKLVVVHASTIAGYFGVSDTLIGLTIVSFGTSLPELAASGMAAYKKKSDIAVGNILGSNIFNIFLILGLSAVLEDRVYNERLNIDNYVVTLASVFLFIAMFVGGRYKLNRISAFLLLVGFVAYLSFILNRELQFF